MCDFTSIRWNVFSSVSFYQQKKNLILTIFNIHVAFTNIIPSYQKDLAAATIILSLQFTPCSVYTQNISFLLLLGNEKKREKTCRESAMMSEVDIGKGLRGKQHPWEKRVFVSRREEAAIRVCAGADNRAHAERRVPITPLFLSATARNNNGYGVPHA